MSEQGLRTLYTPELAQEILEAYTQGLSLLAISKIQGMPSYNTILRWARDTGKFSEEFQRARQARAIHFEERALALATEGPIHKDDAAGERLKFDVLRWGAEVGDPERYGKKVTVAGDPKRPIVFRVVTGVPDPTEHQQMVELEADGTQKLPAEESRSLAGRDGGDAASLGTPSPGAFSEEEGVSPNPEPPGAA